MPKTSSIKIKTVHAKPAPASAHGRRRPPDEAVYLGAHCPQAAAKGCVPGAQEALQSEPVKLGEDDGPSPDDELDTFALAFAPQSPSRWHS